MKKLILFNLSLFFCVCLNATPIDVSTAVNIARNFYVSAMNLGTSAKDAPVVTATESYFTNNKLTFYLVNFSNKGWVLVSADDKCFPVIGFSDEGNLDLANLPPALRWWLDGQSEEAVQAAGKNAGYASYISNTWEKLGNGTMEKSHPKIQINPLLTSNWNQDAGYNFHCPAYPSGPGGRCYAGCVATTMAQIMYYHKYPEHGTGSHYYDHVFFGTLGANFEETTYNWSAMTNSLNNNSKEAISTLISQCGLSVNMNYSPLGSSASSTIVADALKTYFSYSFRVKYYEKSDYENDQWHQLLIDNLELQLPVYYSGSGSSGGHAFVCDGVKDSCFFHFNWGWSGYANGYFYLSNLNSGNGDFSASQAAVMYIAPYDYPYCMGEKQLNSTYKSFNDGSNFSYYWNDTDCSWLIEPDSADHITLTFNSFSTEENHDILSVYKGDDETDSLIGHFSGNSIPAPITVSGNRLYLRFVSDGSVQAQGWTATYTTSNYAGITEETGNTEIAPYPNPASDFVSIRFTNAATQTSITFYNLTGEQFTLPALYESKNQLKIDVKDLPQGCYFVKAVSEQKTYFGKVMIQR
ncbi:MAG TPA: C10 family peptidase [Bacteroidales bacterium]|nr:C10 family peptidase [Bacteroidales bacterium]